MTLTRQAGRGAFWQVAGGGWTTIVRLGASVFLARALTPADYGVFGMAILMRELIECLGSVGGLSSGLIARKDASDDDICTCFWLMLALRIVFFLVAFSCAPIGGWFFGDPRITDVARVISLTILFSIFGGISQTLLTKELRFKELNIARGVFVLLESSLAVTLALNTDWGYWVLVIAGLFNAFFTQLTIFLLARWWPRCKFNRESFRYLFRYGINGLGSGMTSYLRQNLDYLLVGRLLGTASLGIYEFAYRIPHLVLERIALPVGAVLYPALSQFQDDNSQLVRGYVKTVKYVCLVTFPLLFGLAAVADSAVPVFWGEQWLAVITPLQILCLCAALKMIPQPLGAIFYSKNRPDLQFKTSLFGLVWTAIVIGIFGKLFGLIGVAAGMVLSVIVEYIALLIAFKLMNGKFTVLFDALLPIFICAATCGLGALAISILFQSVGISRSVVLFLSVVTGGAIYILSLYLFYPSIFQEVWQTGKEILGTK
ncbi:lipopolysaccharide biosynthesis protein [Desulfogranum marinum]|uniref:lipopolysaccharide biosynthesis protein n=1 Tax=Desulfogranum marinum TaxID=453220 RepID=UPI001962F7A4|nr:lipopolysaccharide biosynthesis protein [Desulfogranum marinum]MBM9514560.1 lipopolysaccharide biosynthesis protein [Desulfogranum marinum]